MEWLQRAAHPLDAVQGTDYPVVIVGSGPVEAELKAHASRLGLRIVHFLGALPDEDKVALLRLCYAVVFPSHLRSEAFGISLLEGAMYGKPLISSEISTGTSYINVSEVFGVAERRAEETRRVRRAHRSILHGARGAPYEINGLHCVS